MDQQLFDLSARAYMEVRVALDTTARLQKALSREIDRRYVLGQDSSHIVLNAFMAWKNRVVLSEQRLALASDLQNPESIDQILNRDNAIPNTDFSKNP